LTQLLERLMDMSYYLVNSHRPEMSYS